MKILVVEDTEDIALLLTAMLPSVIDCTVDVIDDDFVHIPVTAWTSHDATIIDWMLPDVNGCDLARQAKHANPDIHVVLWSAAAEVIHDCKWADRLLRKPASFEDIVAALGV